MMPMQRPLENRKKGEWWANMEENFIWINSKRPPGINIKSKKIMEIIRYQIFRFFICQPIPVMN